MPRWWVIQCPGCAALLDYDSFSMHETFGCRGCGCSFHPESARRVK